MLAYPAVMLGVHAVLLGSGIIAKEETDRTIEFLGVKPVSRSRILFSKLLAAFTAIVILDIVTLAAFILSVFVDLTETPGFLRYVTPFKYFDAKTIYSEDRYSVTYIIITVFAVAGLLAVSRFAYRRRDLAA